MRGEHYTREPSKLGRRGSSPHARGAPLLHRQCGVRRGIIPACAGSTKLLRFSYTQRGDHPRMRGEHAERMHWMEAHQGSSPHARGAHAPRQAPAPRQGIIPACAGSTSRAVATVQDGENHPRMRGEHYVPLAIIRLISGSSPHARGARVADLRSVPSLGIIPACAGSTLEPKWEGDVRGDHPRMRGEHRRTNHQSQLLRGSSPHARGAPLQVGLCRFAGGIIPACAGSTPRVPLHL